MERAPDKIAISPARPITRSARRWRPAAPPGSPPFLSPFAGPRRPPALLPWRRTLSPRLSVGLSRKALPRVGFPHSSGVGELFRADYARRVFNMSRFTALGTIVVERVCDGVVLVCALWIGFAWILFTRFVAPEKSWVILVGAAASIFFGAALIFILVSQRIDLRRFGVMESIATRWDRLIDGVASVLRGHATIVVLCSIGVWILEVLALASVVRSFGVSLSPPESLMLLGLASLSTLVPTAPGYVGTYQLVFAHVFQMFGYQQATGIIAATAVQIFCFGTVTILGGIVLLSRSGLTIWRAHTWVRPGGS